MIQRNLSNGEIAMQSTEMPLTEQVKILKAVDGLPPQEYKQLCCTSDQIHYWWKLRALYNVLHGMLKAHFSGQEINFALLSKDERMIGLILDRYLTFYSVMSWGWQYLTAGYIELQLDDPFPFSSPGELLCRVLENEAAGSFKLCLIPYRRWNPRETTKHQTLSTKAKHGNPLKVAEENWLKKNEREHKRIQAEMKIYLELLPSAIAECRDHANNDVTLKQRLKAFDAAEGALQDILRAAGHHSSGRRGHKWVNGWMSSL